MAWQLRCCRGWVWCGGFELHPTGWVLPDLEPPAVPWHHQGCQARGGCGFTEQKPREQREMPACGSPGERKEVGAAWTWRGFGSCAFLGAAGLSGTPCHGRELPQAWEVPGSVLRKGCTQDVRSQTPLEAAHPTSLCLVPTLCKAPLSLPEAPHGW